MFSFMARDNHLLNEISILGGKYFQLRNVAMIKPRINI